MSSHKMLQSVGITALCEHIKSISSTAGQLAASVIEISEAMQSLSSEVEGLINDIEDEIEDLTVAIVDGVVAAPLATRGSEILATQTGVEIQAIRIL